MTGLPAQGPGTRFELALDIHPGDAKDIQSLRENGWALVAPKAVASGPEEYPSHIAGSKAEFMVPKAMYVDTNSGLLSDQSVYYLASGRPVLARDTGIGGLYPTGEGLLTFSTPDEAAAGVEAINREYARHTCSARRIAEEYFDSDKVLATLLRDLGWADGTRGDILAGGCRLNWGCGGHTRPGWINLDVKEGPGIDLTYDIRSGLPLGSDALDYIASIHSLPEVPYPELVPTLQELRRVLKPGGVLRVSLPDLLKGVDAYRRGDRDYVLVLDEDARSLGAKLVVQLIWYGYSRTVFTPEVIEDMLSRAGFTRVEYVTHGRTSSRRLEVVELDNREPESLFVEAYK